MYFTPGWVEWEVRERNDLWSRKTSCGCASRAETKLQETASTFFLQFLKFGIFYDELLIPYLLFHEGLYF